MKKIIEEILSLILLVLCTALGCLIGMRIWEVML